MISKIKEIIVSTKMNNDNVHLIYFFKVLRQKAAECEPRFTIFPKNCLRYE